MDNELATFFADLQQTMEAALSEAGRLSQAAIEDLDKSAGLDAKIQALLNRYEHEARRAAEAAADEWWENLVQRQVNNG